MRTFEVKDIRTLRFEKPTTVFVCDPCYIFDHTKSGLDEEWQAFVEKMYQDEKDMRGGMLSEAGTLEIVGATMLYTSTAYGDGCYSLETDFARFSVDKRADIGVDAGMICVISEESAMRINPEFNHKKAVSMGAVVYDFKGEITAMGKGFIGDLTVDTEGFEENDDDDWFV